VEKLATRTKLENDVVILAGFGKVDQFHDVGVVQIAHDLDFLEDVCSLRGRDKTLVNDRHNHIR
jgi:hypothetical protein